jgi:hypothetical protein
MDVMLDIAAWIGSTQLVLMYILLSTEKIKARRVYHFFNMTGALFVCLVCVAKEVWQAAAVEGIWCLMAGFFLLRLYLLEPLANRATASVGMKCAALESKLGVHIGEKATKAREVIMAECPQHNVMICGASETVSLDFVPDRITVYEDEQGIARKIEVG